MTSFEYTKEFVVSSSVVDAAYFNENDNTAVLDVDDDMYRYTGVSGSDISTLVRGGDNNSVGAHYNTVFKKKFGPAEHLGFWEDVEPVEVPVNKDQSVPTTPKGLYVVDANKVTVNGTPVETSVVNAYGQRTNLNGDVLDSGETKEYSLSFDDEKAVSYLEPSEAAEPTKEFSLSFDDEAPEASEAEGIEGVTEIVVHFTLNDYDRKFKYVAVGSDTVEGAIEELNDYVSKMRASGRVRKVVVKF